MQDFKFFKEYLFNPSDEVDFKRALKLAISSEDKNILIKKEYVKENYNWDIAAKIYLNEINRSK